MKAGRTTILTAALFLMASSSIFGDRIRLHSGEIIRGKLKTISAGSYIIAADNGEVRVPVGDVENFLIEPDTVPVCLRLKSDTSAQTRCGQRLQRVTAENILIYDTEAERTLSIPRTEVLQLLIEKTRGSSTIPGVPPGTLVVIGNDTDISAAGSNPGFHSMPFTFFIPGVNQIRSGESFRGSVILGTFLLFSFFAVYEYTSAVKFASDANSDPFCSCQYDGGKMARELSARKQMYKGALSGLGGIFAFHLWDLLSRPGGSQSAYADFSFRKWNDRPSVSISFMFLF